MTIVLEPYVLPEHGEVKLDIQRSFVIKITAEQAKRQVNRWVLLEVSCSMGAEAPTLVVGERVVWRVPIVLTASPVGIVGTAGTIDVDVDSGEMNNTAEHKEAIIQSAIELAKKLPPHRPRSVPAEYLAKDLQPTHQP
ncbi:MAG TPA: hypothetical protein PKE45_25730, partial [Caldilineaceae bacterium]|nr:hypothetical protein [Caldilineaceae bacterium]